MKSYSIRIFPNKEQVKQLQKLSDIRMDVWNTLIDIQQKEYETNKRIHNKFNLINLLPNLKNTTKLDWKILNSKAIQTIATEVYGSYQSFFNLIKKDKNDRPPNKKEYNGFHTITFNQSGWIIQDSSNIIINKIPFKYKSQSDITNFNIKELRIKYKNNKWICDLIVVTTDKYKDELTIKAKVLSIDLGIKRLATGVDNNGNTLIIKNKSKQVNKYFSKQINKVKSKLSKKEKGSNNYNKLNKVKSKLYTKKNSQIKQALHIQSKKLVNMNYKTIVVGDLRVKSLMSTTGVNQKQPWMRKSFDESNVTMFMGFLKYKAQAKQLNVIKVDEKYTTQTNCLTGKLFQDKVELNDRLVKLDDSVIIDRDLNSAINILKRYYGNHIAFMTTPLDYSNVVMKYNLCNNNSSMEEITTFMW